MAKNKVFQAVVSLAGSVDPSLGKAAKSATDALDKIDLKALAIAAGVAGIAVAASKAVFEAGKYLADLGGEFDSVTDSIRIGTGATGEALDALNADFEEVYKSVPTTMEDASKAIADYNTRLGLTGEDLQDLSIAAIQVSDMLGDDLGKVIEESSQAFQQWDIDAADMTDAMDYVFKVSQSTGVGFSDLLANAQKFGPQMQEMGYSFETATALMGQLDKAGVNTDEVLGAMKKSVAVLAKEGISASDELAAYYDAIMTAGTEAEAAGIAAEIFGSKAGLTMAAAIRDGTLAAGDFAAQLAENDETIGGAAEDTYDFAENLQLFKQNAQVALKPLANTVFDSLNALMPPIMELMNELAPTIAEVTEVIAPLITDLFTGLMPALQQILPIIMDVAKEIVGKLLPPLMRIINAVLPALISVVLALTPILDLVISLLGPIMSLFESIITPVMDLVTTAIAPLIEMIGNLINTALQPLMPIIEIIGGMFTEYIGGAIEYIMPVIDALMGVFSGLIDFITNIFAGNWEGAWNSIVEVFGSIIDGLVALFKKPINWIIGGINSFLEGINSIKIPDWVPLVGGKGINIPLIPLLADGGFTDGLSIAGEAGMEAVISFDRTVRRENIGYWEQAGEMLGVSDYQQMPKASELTTLKLGYPDFAELPGLAPLDFAELPSMPELTAQHSFAEPPEVEPLGFAELPEPPELSPLTLEMAELPELPTLTLDFAELPLMPEQNAQYNIGKLPEIKPLGFAELPELSPLTLEMAKLSELPSLTLDFAELPPMPEFQQAQYDRLPSGIAGEYISGDEFTNDRELYSERGGGTEIIIEPGAFSFAPQITVNGSAHEEDIIHALQAEEPRFFDLLEEFLSRRGAGSYAGSW